MPIPSALTEATARPPAPAPKCTARDGKPTLCGDQLDEWIQFGWAPKLDEANRDKALIRCLEATAETGKKPKDC